MKFVASTLALAAATVACVVAAGSATADPTIAPTVLPSDIPTISNPPLPPHPKSGLIELFAEPNFGGGSWPVGFQFGYKGPVCVWFNDWGGVAMSIRWKIPITNPHATITFTENSNCTGYSKTWNIKHKDFPRNLALDGLAHKAKAALIRF